MTNYTFQLVGISLFSLLLNACAISEKAPQVELRATGDMGVIIERATGQVQIVDHTDKKIVSEISGLGDLSHASIVYSRDQRYAYVFGRDGGLTKIDLLKDKITKRVIQSGNSIGGAISQDGKLVAVSNYTPGGVKVFNSETLELVATIDSSILTTKPKNKVGSPVRS